MTEPLQPGAGAADFAGMDGSAAMRHLHELLAQTLYGLRVDADGDAYVDDRGVRVSLVVAGDRHPQVVLFTVAVNRLAPSAELFRWVATRADTALCQLAARVHPDGSVALSVRTVLPAVVLDPTELELALLRLVLVAAEVRANVRDTPTLTG